MVLQASDNSHTASGGGSVLSEGRLALLRERVRSGYYDRADVMDLVARSILAGRALPG